LDARERGEEVAIARPPFPTRTTTVLLRFLHLFNDLIERAESEPLTDLFAHLLEVTEYRSFLTEQYDDGAERWENIQQLMAAMAEYLQRDGPGLDLSAGLDRELVVDERAVREPTGETEDERVPRSLLAAFLEDVALVSDVDEVDTRSDAVTLITLHAAKGLEYPVVFIAGLEEGVLPHNRSYDDPAQMEEERRLFYVGITRARERLYLSRAQRRTLMGGSNANPLSRFVKDIPAELTSVHSQRDTTNDSSSASPIRRRITASTFPPGLEPERKAANTGSAYRTGERVRHAKFGDGIIVTSRDTGTDQEVTVAFKGSFGVKKLLVSFAPLERV
ncbi:MAG: 3'-5' exonuclease, partial [Dehalococcoidia bacterium]